MNLILDRKLNKLEQKLNEIKNAIYSSKIEFSTFWVCFWLFLILLTLERIGGNLQEIIKLLKIMTGK